jgi:AcrR family transcriptional regulator
MFSLTPSATTCIPVGMFEAGKDLRRGVAGPRDPVRTRQRLLQAAFQEVYHSGFQGSDLEAILDRAGVTKGALYHHFENKEAPGYAVVDEVIATMMRDKWLRPLEQAKIPLTPWAESFSPPLFGKKFAGCAGAPGGKENPDSPPGIVASLRWTESGA